MGNEGLGEHGLEGVPHVHTAKVDIETSILGQPVQQNQYGPSLKGLQHWAEGGLQPAIP